MDYISKNHSKFLIMVHLIFVCKYRKKLLVKLGEQIKLLMIKIDLEMTAKELMAHHPRTTTAF